MYSHCIALSLAFSYFYLAHFLFDSCYCPLISMPSVFVHHLPLLLIFPALQKWSEVSPQKHFLHHTGCRCSVKFQGSQEMVKTRKFQGMGMFPFHKGKKKRDVRVRRDSLTEQNNEWGRNCGATAVLLGFLTPN